MISGLYDFWVLFPFWSILSTLTPKYRLVNQELIKHVFRTYFFTVTCCQMFFFWSGFLDVYSWWTSEIMMSHWITSVCVPRTSVSAPAGCMTEQILRCHQHVELHSVASEHHVSLNVHMSNLRDVVLNGAVLCSSNMWKSLENFSSCGLWQVCQSLQLPQTLRRRRQQQPIRFHA